MELEKRGRNQYEVGGGSAKEGQEPPERREQYDNLIQYLLSCIGFAVGLGNVWRFPKVALENGGGAFLIPWIVVLVLQGIPIMLVEISIGQRFRAGPVHAFGRMNKWCWGIGATMFFASVYTSLFYNSILSWGYIYFFNSFTLDLPWLSCPARAANLTDCIANPAKFYFTSTVLNAAPDLETGSGIVWTLYTATVIAWLTVYGCMFLGVQSVGKVVYFTCLFPYVVLTILFFIGVTSDGASYGLEYLFKPDWSKLADFGVWQAASEQVFFSASLGFGGLIAMSSYMPVRNMTFRDTFIILLVNSGTSIFAALGIFSIKGYMAKDEYTRCQSNEIPHCDITRTIQDYVSDADSSAGLVFISMAKAQQVIGDGYGASVLSMLFYLMIITLGLDSAFGSLEGYLAVLKDLGVTARFGYKRVLTFCIAASIVFALLFSSKQGIYFIDIFDKYGVVLVLLFTGLFELIAVGWIYGLNEFARDFKLLNGFGMDYFTMFLLKFTAPAMILITVIGTFVSEIRDDKLLTYSPAGTEVIALPWWATLLALMLFCSAVIWIPAGAIITLVCEKKLHKPLSFGEVDFDLQAMRSELPVRRYNKFLSRIFWLKQYDYPEN